VIIVQDEVLKCCVVGGGDLEAAFLLPHQIGADVWQEQGRQGFVAQFTGRPKTGGLTNDFEALAPLPDGACQALLPGGPRTELPEPGGGTVGGCRIRLGALPGCLSLFRAMLRLQTEPDGRHRQQPDEEGRDQHRQMAAPQPAADLAAPLLQVPGFSGGVGRWFGQGHVQVWWERCRSANGGR